MTAAELRARGNAALREGRLDEARELYRQAAATDPRDPAPWLNMGFIDAATSRWAEAKGNFDRAITLAAPGDDVLADAHFLRGRAQQELGGTESALADYRAAATARKGFAEPVESAALLLLDMKRYEESLEWARRAAGVRPNPQNDLVAARALDKLGRPTEAIGVLAKLLDQDPNNVLALEDLGTTQLRLGRDGEALKAFERILSLDGGTITGLSNLALASHRLGRAEDASRYVQRAVALGPASTNDFYNVCIVLLEMLRVDQAMDLAGPVAARHPDDMNIAWIIAMGHLLRGELGEGFKAYESRFTCTASSWKEPAPDFGRPRWTGSQSLAGKSILVIGEQGLGDAIQMLRYVPRLAAQANLVLLRMHPGVTPLMKQLPANCRWEPETRAPPPTDFQVPSMSLPLAFATTRETVPAAVPYVEVDRARAQTWRKRLDALGPSPKAGIVWAGNPGHANDRNRSVPLRVFRGIERPGVTFVSLQAEVRASDKREYEQWPGLARFGEELKDFGDTAALMGNLDLVISVDSSPAHAAGALGRPLWVLLPHYPDWRWMLDRDDSPWYPTARLWRQPRPGDWSSVIAALRTELAQVKRGGAP